MENDDRFPPDNRDTTYRDIVSGVAAETRELLGDLLHQFTNRIRQLQEHVHDAIAVSRQQAERVQQRAQTLEEDEIITEDMDDNNGDHRRFGLIPVAQDDANNELHQNQRMYEQRDFDEGQDVLDGEAVQEHDLWPERRQAEGEQEPGTNANQCRACNSDLAPHEIIRLGCGHAWCSQCLNLNARISLRSRQDYPAHCCDRVGGVGGVGGIDLFAVKDHFEDDVLARLAVVGEEYSDKNPTYCFDPKCSAYIQSPEAHGRFPFQWATCEKCKKVTCVECKGSKSLHPSPDQHPELLSEEDKELMKSKGWKQCPNARCRKMIEKITGCEHMKCECGTHFCYKCGRHLNLVQQATTELTCTCVAAALPPLWGQHLWAQRPPQERVEQQNQGPANPWARVPVVDAPPQADGV